MVKTMCGERHPLVAAVHYSTLICRDTPLLLNLTTLSAHHNIINDVILNHACTIILISMWQLHLKFETGELWLSFNGTQSRYMSLTLVQM